MLLLVGRRYARFCFMLYMKAHTVPKVSNIHSIQAA